MVGKRVLEAVVHPRIDLRLGQKGYTYFSVIYTDVKYTSFFSSLESGVQYYICQDEFSQVM